MSIAAAQKIRMAQDALGRAADQLRVNAYDAVARKYAREQLRKCEAWIKEAREHMRVVNKKEQEAQAQPDDEENERDDQDNGGEDDTENGDHDALPPGSVEDTLSKAIGYPPVKGGGK